LTNSDGLINWLPLDRLQQLRFLIKLQLNRSDSFDRLVIEKIDSISGHVYDVSRAVTENEIDILINSTQDLLKLEWEGVKEESKKGNLSKSEKRKLYGEFLKSKTTVNSTKLLKDDKLN
jgi:hypothetical protein